MNSQREQTKSGHSRSIPMMVWREGNYSVCTAKPATPSTSFSTNKTKKARTDLKNEFGAACVIAGLDDCRFHDLRHTAAPGSPAPALTLERSWRFSAIDAFKHLRVIPTRLTRVCDVQWKHLRDCKRVPSQKVPTIAKRRQVPAA
jgi:hypothetical protein